MAKKISIDEQIKDAQANVASAEKALAIATVKFEKSKKIKSDQNGLDKAMKDLTKAEAELKSINDIKNALPEDEWKLAEEKLKAKVKEFNGGKGKMEGYIYNTHVVPCLDLFKGGNRGPALLTRINQL